MSLFDYNCKEDFLDELRDFLKRKTKLSNGTIDTYLKKIESRINVEWSVGDLCGAIDTIIEDYGVGGRRYDANDSGNTRAALQKVRLFVREKMLDNFGELKIVYKKGWQSFVPVDKHVVEYVIDGDKITIKYNKHFAPIAKPEVKDIPTRDLDHLIYLLKKAINLNLLALSNTAMSTVHGKIQSYDYELSGNSGTDCSSLFKDDNSKIADDLRSDYDTLIKKVIG